MGGCLSSWQIHIPAGGLTNNKDSGAGLLAYVFSWIEIVLLPLRRQGRTEERFRFSSKQLQKLCGQMHAMRILRNPAKHPENMLHDIYRAAPAVKKNILTAHFKQSKTAGMRELLMPPSALSFTSSGHTIDSSVIAFKSASGSKHLAATAVLLQSTQAGKLRESVPEDAQTPPSEIKETKL